MTMIEHGRRTPRPAARAGRASRGTAVLVTVVAVLVVLGAACGDASTVDADRFCEIHADIGAIDDLHGTPDEVRAQLSTIESLIDEASEVAPPGISASVQALGVTFADLLDAVEAADYDLGRVDDARMQEIADRLADPDLGLDTIDAWVSANCTTR